jgi:hypothetical protein
MPKDNRSALSVYWQASLIRLRAQTKWLHVGLVHLAIFLIFFTSDILGTTAISLHRNESSVMTWQTLLYGSLWLLFILMAYRLTSYLEHDRLKNSESASADPDHRINPLSAPSIAENTKLISAGPSRLEKWSQGAGNLLLLALVLYGAFFLPYDILCAIYLISVVRTIRAILVENHITWRSTNSGVIVQ